VSLFDGVTSKQSDSSTAYNSSSSTTYKSLRPVREEGNELSDRGLSEDSARRDDRRDTWTSYENVDDDDVSTNTRSQNRRDKWAREAAADEEASVDRRSSNTKSSRKDRSDRRDRYEVDEDNDYGATSKGARGSDRKAGRSSRDEDDEGAAGREEARARKQARQAERAAQLAAEREAARAEREARAAAKTLTVKLPEFVSVQNLSQALGVRYERFVNRLQELGYEDIFPGKIFNSEISGMIALEYNFEPIFEAGVHEDDNRDLKALPESEQEDLPPRPPVVTIMGHVDHGKTTILDYIRKSSVAAGEAGGITQHIGAFSVPMTSSSKPVTFLDTPGHEAFLAMRQRGANVTDIVILVVAADDSVKPQTIEAIKHAKAAQVPIIVAVNKVDKEEADVQRVKQDLARHGIDIEDYGGETQVVPVSGKTGLGMDVLEENIVTLSEILDHRASTEGQVEGWVIESSTKLSGRVATVLVRRGTLRVGDIIVAGKTWARVRTLKNEAGEAQEEVGPGMPVEVDGWNEQPAAGDEVLQAPNEQKATSVVEFRIEKHDREQIAKDMEVINVNRQEQQIRHAKEKAAKEEARRNAHAARQAGIEIQVAPETETPDRPTEDESGQKLIPFIIKADVSGSVEAVSAYVLGVSHPLIAPKILHADVGAIHESDIDLAEAAKAHIIAFNLPTNNDMRHNAETKGIQILENNIIYRVLDDVKAVLEAALPPLITKKVIGEAEIGKAFDINIKGRKYQRIAGCKIRNGAIRKGSLVRIMRDGEEIYDGKQIRTKLFQDVSTVSLTYSLAQARSPRSKTSRKTSMRCAREPSVEWASPNGRASRSAIRSRPTRKSARSGISDHRTDQIRVRIFHHLQADASVPTKGVVTSPFLVLCLSEQQQAISIELRNASRGRWRALYKFCKILSTCNDTTCCPFLS
jgi:translation initiation factor IF-2